MWRPCPPMCLLTRRSRHLIFPGAVYCPGAFEYSALQKVATGIDVTEINDGAFRNCRKLSSVELNEDVTRIGDNAFSACTALTSIDFPESLVSIGDYAFIPVG